MGFGATGGEEEDGDDVVEEAGRWGGAPARTSSGRRQAQSERRRVRGERGEGIGILPRSRSSGGGGEWCEWGVRVTGWG